MHLLTNASPITFGTSQVLTGLNMTYQRCCETCNDTADAVEVGPPMLESYEIWVGRPTTYEILFYDHPTCDDQVVKFKLTSTANVGLTFASGSEVQRCSCLASEALS